VTALRVLIVDDEPLARRGIRDLCAEHEDVAVVGEAGDGQEAVRLLKSSEADLVFLDVQMPEMDGFEVIRRVGPRRMPAVIFVTAFDSYAVGAFETHAIDYLVKPVHERRFHRALERAREVLRSSKAAALADRLGELLAAQGVPSPADSIAPSRRVLLQSGNSELVLDAAEIDWVSADDYYAAVHAHGRRFLIRESLESLEQRLDPQIFVRVHRSAVVNLARVRQVQANPARLVLSDGTRVPISRRRRAEVLESLRRYAG